MQALTTTGQGNTWGTNYCFPASWTNFFFLIPKSLVFVSQNKHPVWLLNILIKG